MRFWNLKFASEVPLNCGSFNSTALMFALIPLVPVDETEYDHVRLGLASVRPVAPQAYAGGRKTPCIAADTL